MIRPYLAACNTCSGCLPSACLVVAKCMPCGWLPANCMWAVHVGGGQARRQHVIMKIRKVMSMAGSLISPRSALSLCCCSIPSCKQDAFWMCIYIGHHCRSERITWFLAHLGAGRVRWVRGGGGGAPVPVQPLTSVE